MCDRIYWARTSKKLSLLLCGGRKFKAAGIKAELYILTTVGDVPFTPNSTNWGNKEAAASDINFFVKNAKRRLLRLSQDDRWLGWTGGYIVARRSRSPRVGE